MRVREESESVAICSPFYSSPEAANVFLAKRLSLTLCIIDTKMFLLTLVKGVPFQLFLLPSNVLFDQVSFVPFHLYPMEGEGGGIFQMFFFNSGRMYLLTSACGGGGISNVLLNSGRLYLLTSACGGGGISNVLLNSGRLYLFTSA